LAQLLRLLQLLFLLLLLLLLLLDGPWAVALSFFCIVYCCCYASGAGAWPLRTCHGCSSSRLQDTATQLTGDNDTVIQ
jgi:hypothetical protein